MVFNNIEDRRGNILPLFPMLIKPLLQLIYIIAHLDIELDILGKPRFRKIAGTYKGVTGRHIHCLNKLIPVFVTEICYIGFCMELIFIVHSAFNFSRFHRIQNGRNAYQKLVFFMLHIDTIIET